MTAAHTFQPTVVRLATDYRRCQTCGLPPEHVAHSVPLWRQRVLDGRGVGKDFTRIASR